MKHRTFDLVESLVVAATILVIIMEVLPFMSRQNVSTPVKSQPVIPPSPERNSDYEVHSVILPPNFSLETTHIHDTLVTWLRAHPSCKVVSVIRADDGMLVIITENR